MEIDKQLLQKRIVNLCEEINKKPTSVFIECGVGKNFFSNLQTSNPSIGKITILANYFGVNVKYLTGETDQKEKPAENDRLEENTILLAMRDGGVKKRKLTSEQMELIEKMIEQMPQADDDL